MLDADVLIADEGGIFDLGRRLTPRSTDAILPRCQG